MRDEAFFAQVVVEGEVFPASAPFRSAVLILFEDELIPFADEFAFGVRAQIEIAAMRDAFEFAEFPFGQEGERVFDIRGADGIVRQLSFFMLAHSQTFAREPHVDVPLEAPIAPEAIPLLRLRRMAEEFDFHLFEFAAAEGEVARRDFVAETLADLPDAKRDARLRAVDDVLEVDEDPLRGFRAQERGVVFAAEGPDGRLEHQVKFARFRQRADMLRVGSENLREIVVRERVDSQDVLFPFEGVGVLLAQTEELERGLFERLDFILRFNRRDEDAFARRGLSVFSVLESGDPAPLNVVESIALLAFAAVDHEVVEEIVVTGAFPDLRVHDDGAIEPSHLEFSRRAGKEFHFVMADDHIVPPGVFNVSFEKDAEGPVVPESVQTAVNFA